jgi:hypothetical protein
MNDLVLQKIKEEKRRRNQTYITLNYFFYPISYFDFFSKDAFSLTLRSKWLTYFLGKKEVSSELFLFLLFDSTFQASKVLKKYSQKKENEIKTFFSEYRILSSFSSQTKRLFSKWFFPVNEETLDEISFSEELQFLFEKAADNARERFKTPVITPEILLITFMEEKTTQVFQPLQNFLEEKISWYLCRYQLIKNIHYHESAIRSEVSINQQYFAYLFQLYCSENQFDRVIKEEQLNSAIALFRNTLVSLTLNQSIFEALTKETYQSIKLTKLTKGRNYSND